MVLSRAISLWGKAQATSWRLKAEAIEVTGSFAYPTKESESEHKELNEEKIGELVASHLELPVVSPRSIKWIGSIFDDTAEVDLSVPSRSVSPSIRAIFGRHLQSLIKTPKRAAASGMYSFRMGYVICIFGI